MNLFNLHTSIINGGSDDAIDPFNFIDFVKYSNSSNVEQDYNDYLINWHKKSLKSHSELQQSIKNQYISLLKRITDNFTTLDEKRVLINTDWTKEHEVSAALPIYSRKIKELITYYTRKREDAKEAIVNYKMIGSTKGIEHAIYSSIVSRVLSSNNIKDVTSILQELEITVDEYYDMHSEYFDISNSKAEKVTDLIMPLINFDAYRSEILDEISTYVDHLGSIQKIDIPLKFDDISSLIDREIKDEWDYQIKEDIEIRRGIYSKYIDADINYVNIDEQGNRTSGTLIKADLQDNNIHNIGHINVTNQYKDELKHIRSIGNHFNDNNGTIFLNKVADDYVLLIDDVKLDTTYIFADPTRRGNVDGNSEAIYHLYDSSSIKNSVEPNMFNLPDARYNRQDMSGYSSYPIIAAFSDIWNDQTTLNGVMTSHVDMNGIEFATFKVTDNIKTISNVDVFESDITVTCLNLDGHKFKDFVADPINGNFDYSISSNTLFEGSYRSGISTKTTLTNTFDIDNTVKTLWMRNLVPFEWCSTSNSFDLTIYNGFSFTRANGAQFPNSFYEVLLDGHISTTSNNFFEPSIDLIANEILHIIDSGEFSGIYEEEIIEDNLIDITPSTIINTTKLLNVQDVGLAPHNIEALTTLVGTTYVRFNNTINILSNTFSDVHAFALATVPGSEAALTNAISLKKYKDILLVEGESHFIIFKVTSNTSLSGSSLTPIILAKSNLLSNICIDHGIRYGTLVDNTNKFILEINEIDDNLKRSKYISDDPDPFIYVNTGSLQQIHLAYDEYQNKYGIVIIGETSANENIIKVIARVTRNKLHIYSITAYESSIEASTTGTSSTL